MRWPMGVQIVYRKRRKKRVQTSSPNCEIWKCNILSLILINTRYNLVEISRIVIITEVKRSSLNL